MKKVKIFLGNERLDSFQLTEEAPEDAISGALLLSIMCSFIIFAK